MKLLRFGIILGLCFSSITFGKSKKTKALTYTKNCTSKTDTNCNINLDTSSNASKQRRVASNGSIKMVNNSGYCKIVTNTSGKDMFVPLNTSAERSANSGGSSGITYTDC